MSYVSLYCDGGIIGANPSAVGGTWAFVVVDPDENRPLHSSSGVVTPEDAGLPTVTNNYTELRAALEALDEVKDGWAGKLYTDSNVTRCRLTNPRAALKGIPEYMEIWLYETRSRLGAFTVVLLSGHPTQKQLEEGKGSGGRPVSEWNVLCDQMCTAEASRYRRRR